MPPQIALLICILFIFFLFRIDSKRPSNVSNALWIPLIWMTIIGSRLVSQWLNVNDGIVTTEAYIEGNSLDRNIFILLIVIGLFILYRRNIHWSKILKNNVWIFVMFVYAGISIVWSEFPFVSFKRWFKTVGNLVMVLIVLTEPNSVEAIKRIFKRCAYMLVPLSILLIKYYPHLGRTYHPWTGEVSWIGVATGKNGLGILCVIFGFFFSWNLLTMLSKKNLYVDKKEIFVHIVLLFMILWLLIKANSATSVGSFIIGICILIGLSIIKRNVRSIGVYIFSAISIFLFLQLSFDITGNFTLSLGREMTLTGRTELWKELLDMGSNPLIGTGFESFWLGDRLKVFWEKYWWLPNQAHNGYLEIYLNLGLIGLFLLIAVIFSSYRNICRSLMYDFEYGRFQMGLFIVVLIYNITEASLKGISPVWFIFLLIVMDIPRSRFQILEDSKSKDINMVDIEKNPKKYVIS